jgi:hypothetical protein
MELNKRESVPEMLQRFNDGDTLTLLKQNFSNESLKMLFGYGFIPKGKWLLPEGTPPYREDAAPVGMARANLWMEIKKFERFMRADLNKLRREQLFIQLLEELHPLESKLVLAIKDQTIPDLYPNITLDKVVDAGFFIWPHGIDETEYRNSVKNKEVKPAPIPKSESNPPVSGKKRVQKQKTVENT